MSEARAGRSLLLEALARLDLLSSADDEPDGDSLLDDLVAKKKLAPHQARAVRALIERNAVTCACGERQLAPESSRDGFACRACGAAVSREPPPLALPKPAPARLPTVGSRIGPLELVAVLGKGAYGVVFRAKNHVLGRESAVKVIPGGGVDQRVRRRFHREIEALGRLRHPAIVKVHATHEVDGALVLEMELVDGEDLDAKLRRGPLPWREAASLVRTVARGIAHAHRANVVHRDLKPANVIVQRDGTPRIVDFGLARFDDIASSLTRAGALIGTPLYMAPEAFSGSAGPESDVYGLGAILAQAVSGRAPFTASTPEELMVQITRGRCAPIGGGGVPASLERVRARAMAPKVAERYRDADALADDLERVLEGQPIAGPGGPKLPLVAGGVLLALAAALALVAGLLHQAGRPPPWKKRSASSRAPGSRSAAKRRSGSSARPGGGCPPRSSTRPSSRRRTTARCAGSARSRGSASGSRSTRATSRARARPSSRRSRPRRSRTA